MAVLLFTTLGACSSFTLSDFEGKYPAGTTAATYQNATIQRCAYRPTEATVQALLAKNELFRDPNTMAAAICSQKKEQP